MLVGMENLMCYFYTEPNAVRELFHRIMDFQLGIARHYLAIGVDMVYAGDDLGTQRGLLLGPALVNDFMVPEYRRLFSLYRQHGVIINFHSCGHIEPLVETFMDLGIAILNPLQASANNLAAIRRKTMDRMALMGGISSDLMLHGPPKAIEREARAKIKLLGLNGGYFCEPDQSLPWPEEHYAALRETVNGYMLP
ncbi:MAG: uroporphyrinogen decarboxylase family protein [Anaerolineae bacterium]